MEGAQSFIKGIWCLKLPRMMASARDLTEEVPEMQDMPGYIKKMCEKQKRPRKQTVARGKLFNHFGIQLKSGGSLLSPENTEGDWAMGC